jgi:predicted enzyme related to lactoylglutathione lyase
MLSGSTVEANVPASDLARAREFYATKLGLTPVSEMAGIFLQYRTDSGTGFNIYQTEHAGKAGHTIAQWHVADVESEVRDLKARGVVFEVYPDMPGVDWKDEVAVMPGMGKAAWFTDSEGNIMCIDEPPQGA